MAEIHNLHEFTPLEEAVRETARIQKQVITIYVRQGEDRKQRVISINPIPKSVDPLHLLNCGFALDGNSASLSVDRYTYVCDDDEEAGRIDAISSWSPEEVVPGAWAHTWTLTKAINSVERTLVAWLKGLGCEVIFN